MDRPAWVNPSLFPFTSRWVDLDGARIHYVDEGDGPVLLMLHGNPTWSFLFRHLILGLRDRFRCVALDYPGFGLSTPPPGYGFRIAEHARVVERFVEHLDLRDVAPVVQDWGGPIGTAFAVRHPDRVRAFVIGNTWAWPATKPMMRAFSWLFGGPPGGLLVRRLDAFARFIVPQSMRLAHLTAAERAMYIDPHPTPASREPVQVMPREIVAARALLEETAAGLERVADRPALIVWGTEDPAFSTAERQRWEATFADHRTHVLDGAGHYIWEEAPDEIVAAIRDWYPAVVAAG